MRQEDHRLAPSELYPAGEAGMQARMVLLSSGLRVRIVEAGDASAPPVILIPGWGCSAWIFHDTILPLARAGLRPIIVELKGHGLSDKPAARSEYTCDAMRDHLIDVLDALKLDRAGIVGHSMGAAIAVHVAAHSPERVDGVVLVAPVGFAGVPLLELFKAVTPSFAIPILPYLARPFLVRLMLGVVYGSLRGASGRDVDEFWSPTQLTGCTRALRHLLHHFFWNAPFPKLDRPWLTIVGTEDRLSDSNDIGRYACEGREVASIVIEKAGHVMFDEAPALVNDAIAGFFERVTRPEYISTQNE